MAPDASHQGNRDLSPASIGAEICQQTEMASEEEPKTRWGCSWPAPGFQPCWCSKQRPVTNKCVSFATKFVVISHTTMAKYTYNITECINHTLPVTLQIAFSQMMQRGADARREDDDGITHIYWGLAMCLAPSTHDLSGPSHQPLEKVATLFAAEES